MPTMGNALRFQQIHIDVARNSTDDFNPFHDKNRWKNIVANPFAEPILLGFQLECLIENQIRLYRALHDENAQVETEGLRFSNYEFKFVNAVQAGQEVSVIIKESQFKSGSNPTLSNRVSLKADGKLAVAGFKRESSFPLVIPDVDLAALGDLNQVKDRSFIADSAFFLKRKYVTTSNAKNFLSSALAEQADYIDEIGQRVQFPETFPCAMLSCALLERALLQGHDFEREPMVYKSHKFSIDRDCLQQMRSNDALHLLSRHTDPVAQTPVYDCFGILGSGRLLFSARIDLMPLASSAS